MNYPSLKIVAYGNCKIFQKRRGQMENMKRESYKLPFDLKDLENVKVSYCVYSSRLGAGRQEIHIAGKGEVTLFLTVRYDSEPIIRTGSVSKDIVMRLLELFESEEFITLDEEIVGNEGQGARLMRLQLGDKDYSVRVIGARVIEFERLVGAIKLVASITFPEVSQGTFFSHL